MKEPTSSHSDSKFSRRAFLGGVAVATTPLLAGCSRVTDNTFTGTRVSIPSGDADGLGFEEIARDELTRVEEGRSYGLGTSTTITSPYTIYQSLPSTAENGADSDEPDWTISSFATPRADVLSNEQNPLVDLSSQRYLSTGRIRSFRESAGLGEIDRAWARNSTWLGSEPIEALGQTASMVTRAGFLPGPEAPDPSLLVAYYSKVELDSQVVVLFGVQEWPTETTRGTILGPDGHITETELAAKDTVAKTAFSAFQHE